MRPKRLIAEMDGLLGDHPNIGEARPETKGMVVICVMTCAYFCEVALKTLQSSLNGGFAFAGHDLEELYDKVEGAYTDTFARNLEQDILAEVTAYYPQLSMDGVPTDVRSILAVGGRSFEEWRYGWQEARSADMANGVPRHLREGLGK